MKDFFWFIARMFVGLVFSFSGLVKLLEPSENFAAVLDTYPFISLSMARVLSVAVPWFEWVVGFFILLGFMTRFMARLLLIFAIGISSILILSIRSQGAGTECGCFGSGFWHLTQAQVLILDLFNVFILLRLSLKRYFVWSLDSFLPSIWEIYMRLSNRKIVRGGARPK